MSWAEITPQARTLLTEAADQSLSLVLRGVERPCWRCQHVSVPPVLLHPEGHLGYMSWVESVEGHGLALVKDYLAAAGHHAASRVKSTEVVYDGFLVMLRQVRPSRPAS